jgi:hypothetical protein
MPNWRYFFEILAKLGLKSSQKKITNTTNAEDRKKSLPTNIELFIF